MVFGGVMAFINHKALEVLDQVEILNLGFLQVRSQRFGSENEQIMSGEKILDICQLHVRAWIETAVGSDARAVRAESRGGGRMERLTPFLEISCLL